MPKKVSFLIDGFNVYHSLHTLGKMTGASVKWLDPVRLCEGYLQVVRGGTGERVELAEVHYFSALAEHLAARTARSGSPSRSSGTIVSSPNTRTTASRSIDDLW